VSAPVVAACDLDRTLIYSRRSAAAPSGFDRQLVCVERYLDQEQSFVSVAALEGIRSLATRAVFVPTTTRTRAQAERVRFPGLSGLSGLSGLPGLPGLPGPRFQIVANGGVLLVDGAPDRDWAGLVRRTLADSGVPVEAVRQYLSSWQAEPWLLRARVAEELFCYAVIDREALPPDTLAEIHGWTAARGWQTSVQGSKLYLVPAALNKESAVAEVARRVGAARVIAAGDSLLDRAMLVAADAGIRPGHGELAAEGWGAPHVIALQEQGVVAGERIVDWMVDQVGHR
jgi:hypothetical protein